MIYSVMPMEMIYPQELPETQEEQVGGARLVWQVSGGQRRLMRVISSDLRDYLRYKL